MKSTNPAVRTAIRTAHELKAEPRLTAEWNMNRYREATVDNTPSEETAGHDIDMFPIDSIVEPVRPGKGINKARVNASVIADKYITIHTPRFYVAGLEDKYKYWMSPYPSDSQGNISGVAPRVIYSSSVRTNKIVVGIENTWATPISWSIQTTDDGTTWRTASTNPVIGNDGRAVIYWGGSNWSSNKPSTSEAHTVITGMRIVVTRLGPGRTTNGAITQYIQNKTPRSTTGANSYFSLIEMSALSLIHI